MTRLTGKVAIVTGATSGIGRSIAEAFAREGAFVVATGRNAARGAETVSRIEAAGGRASFVAQDITVEADWERVVSGVVEQHGRLDSLVNSAGIFFAKSLPDTSIEEFRDIWRIDVEALFMGMRCAGKVMTGQKGGGSIVNISSLAGQIGLEDASAYCTAKAGLNHLTRAAALDLARFENKVRVNAVAPGVIWSELIFSYYGESEEGKAAVIAGNSLQRPGYPEDIANAALYLASDDARHVTGTVLLIDGGRGAD